MIKRAFYSVILLIFAFGFTYINTYAQQNNTDTAVLKGTVVEASTENPISDIEVQLKDTDMSAMTDSTGYFEFTGLEPGTYTIHIEVDGYQTYQQEVDLSSGDVELAIKLEEASNDNDDGE